MKKFFSMKVTANLIIWIRTKIYDALTPSQKRFSQPFVRIGKFVK